MKRDAASPNVLIVEDQEVIQDLLMTVFEHEGISAVCAGTVASGMERLADGPTHVVLDLHLPDGRGTDVLRTIRAGRMPIRVAVTTGALDPDLIAEAESLAPDRTFQKPYRAADIARWVLEDRAETSAPRSARRSPASVTPA